jgi:SAM-dependent methyltransferase
LTRQAQPNHGQAKIPSLFIFHVSKVPDLFPQQTHVTHLASSSSSHHGLKTNDIMMNRLKLLAKSWSIAANGYNDLLVPRFAPWTDDVLKAVAHELPKSIPKPRRCCVPCCGPGQELLPLSQLLGSEWSVLGVDLAPGMIDVARQRIANEQAVDAVVGDCSTSLPGDDPYDLIVSIFGFQHARPAVGPTSVARRTLD